MSDLINQFKSGGAGSGGAPLGDTPGTALGTAAAGTSGAAARADHVHPKPTPAELGAAATGHTHTAAEVGASPSSHTHTAAEVGAAPSSHVGATGTAHGNATTGVAGFMSSTDKSKLDGIASSAAALGTTMGTALGTAAAGTATTAAKSDHVHPMPTAAQVGAAAAGHTHTAAEVGAAPSSHVGATGAAHGNATTSVAGFLSATDKTKLDGIASSAAALGDTAGAALGTAAAGAASTAARSDHVHPFPTAANIGALALTGGTLSGGLVGTAAQFSGTLTASSVNGITGLASAAGAALAAAGAVGTSTLAARQDHVHPYPTAANVGALPIGGGTLTGALNGTTAAFSGAVTGTSFNSITGLASVAGAALGGAGAVGTSTLAARQDHVHPYPTAANIGALALTGGTLSGGLVGTAAQFSGTLTASSVNGITGLASAAGAALAAAGAVGTSTLAARQDHVHPYPTAAQIGAAAASHTHDILLAIDDRDVKPNATGIGGNKAIRAFFTSKEGLTGTAGTDYQDLMVLDTYSDASGGNVNALAFDKSTQQILHYQADRAATSWGTPKTLAYLGSAVGTALASSAAAGTSTDAARADHVHPYPTPANIGALALTGGTLSGGLVGTAAQFSGDVSAATFTMTGALTYDGHQILNGTDSWIRTKNSEGVYFSTHGGGLHMTDATWVRVYNNKGFMVNGSVDAINHQTPAADGNGYRFWQSDDYKIWMSSAGNGTWGGELDTASDYNFYYRLKGGGAGTTRGHVWKGAKDGTESILAHLTKNGLYLNSVPLRMGTTEIISTAGSWTGNNLSQSQTHNNADTDASTTALHHTLGSAPTQAAPGNHTHDGYAPQSGNSINQIRNALPSVAATDGTAPYWNMGAGWVTGSSGSSGNLKSFQYTLTTPITSECKTDITDLSLPSGNGGGKQFTLQWEEFMDGLSAGSMDVLLTWYNSSSVAIGSAVNLRSTTTANKTPGWAYRWATVTAPTGAAKFALSLKSTAGAANNSPAYVAYRRLKLENNSGASPFTTERDDQTANLDLVQFWRGYASGVNKGISSDKGAQLQAETGWELTVRAPSLSGIAIGVTTIGRTVIQDNMTFSKSGNGIDVHVPGHYAFHFQSTFDLYSGAIGSGTHQFQVNTSGHIYARGYGWIHEWIRDRFAYSSLGRAMVDSGYSGSGDGGIIYHGNYDSNWGRGVGVVEGSNGTGFMISVYSSGGNYFYHRKRYFGTNGGAGEWTVWHTIAWDNITI